ncbi:hypothetical protein [Nocardiopsis rhodophaea]|uniref:hypothetical protein n=1 Tax=Nocardiopsis rhodophaea TaxID=280238 RepID=UPI0031DCA311
MTAAEQFADIADGGRTELDSVTRLSELRDLITAFSGVGEVHAADTPAHSAAVPAVHTKVTSGAPQ